MRNHRVNSITYGAIICALVGALLLVNRQFAGAFDVYMLWIIPIPVIVYCVKFGTKDTMVMGIAMVLLSFVVSSPTSIFYVAASVVAGIIYGDGFNKGKSATYLICSVILVSMFITIITMYVFASVFGYDLVGELDMFAEFFNNMLNTAGLSIESLGISDPSKFLITLIVIADVITSVMEGLLVHLLTFLVLHRLKMKLPPMKKFSEIYCPNWLKFLIFVANFAYIMAAYTKVTQYNDIIVPVYVVASFIQIVFGYLFVLDVFGGRNKTRSQRTIFTLALIGIMFIAPPVLGFVGLIDIFTPLRRKLKERININE